MPALLSPPYLTLRLATTSLFPLLLLLQLLLLSLLPLYQPQYALAGPVGAGVETACDFEQLTDCRWYFSNSKELERILKVQRLSPLAQPPPVIHFQEQRALSRQANHKETRSHPNNFYVVVSGGGNVSSESLIAHL